MIGKQDERERLETYERMAVCYAYLHWGSLLVCGVSWMIGWEAGQNCGLAFSFIGHSGARLGKTQRYIGRGDSVSPKDNAGNGQRGVEKSTEGCIAIRPDGCCDGVCCRQTLCKGCAVPFDSAVCGIAVFGHCRRHIQQRVHAGEKDLARTARR